ncbi:FAST kinase domain-containing protein 5, mitochondrial [Drosophila obscura]|uniref:FAST kinase domain-containing protein 5, mitochondrial n=1 Tax=Drosophila obscura TaxID=7282 RepID=UPI001BB0E180|nr:FAST kinase domain-containing protein 5, mitochondrial [Drosophila obscura]XP_041447849.1 FAST kinase domain-containing protein 5, mitochondrial [Drosophila obscura]
MWTRVNCLWRSVGRQAPRLLCRHIRTSVIVPAKIFVDRENQFAHSILSESLKPYHILRPIESPLQEATSDGYLEPGRNLSPAALYANFLALVQHCAETNTQISEPQFDGFARTYCEQMHHLSDDQVLGTMRALGQLPKPESTKTRNYMELWNTLDIECCRRIERWPTGQLLLVSDAWYQLGLARIGEYVWLALKKLGRKLRKLPPEQLVQSMFLCNLLRRPIFEMFDFEMNLARCIDQMTLQELGVMAMGFFKTQTQIRNPELLNQLFARLTRELDTVEDITLVSLLKVLRYSSKLPHVEPLIRLLRDLEPQVERVSLLACLHMALLGCELQTCDDQLIERILQRFEQELDHARLKDMERIGLVMALFNLESVSGVERRLAERLPDVIRQRLDEIMRYPRCFTNCLQFLTMRGVYDAELLGVALEPRFLQHAYRGGLPGREYFHLDGCARLLGKDVYKGPLLTERQIQQMGKLYTQYIPEREGRFKLNKTDRILVDVRDAASDLYRHLSFKHILPQYERCDLVLCYDRRQQRALPIDAEACPPDYSGVILTRRHLLGADREHDDQLATVIVVIAGWNNVIRDKQRHTGQLAMKLKQLKQMGHQPVVIYWHEWRELETSADRQDFLKRRLRQAAGI